MTSKSFPRLGIFGRQLVGCTAGVTAFLAVSSSSFAQAEPPPDAPAPAASSPSAGENGGRRGQRGNFNPEELQQRMMNSVREQMGVTDDAEWKLISERITAVMEARRSTMAPMGGMGFGPMGGRGGNGGGNAGGNNRMARNASPEQESLRQAITDKLPDAEIKSRLTRFRDSRKANEEKLAHAQEELRAVLSVRQEALAVLSGYLP